MLDSPPSLHKKNEKKETNYNMGDFMLHVIQK